MAFMNYYDLVRYETDPKLQNMFRMAIHKHWYVEKYERNPFLNFAYAACCLGKTRTDPWGTIDLSPTGEWLEESIDTLKRYPLDCVAQSSSNAHRIDMVPLQDHVRDPCRNVGYGGRNDGYAFRIDEQMFFEWGGPLAVGLPRRRHTTPRWCPLHASLLSRALSWIHRG